MGRDGVGLQRVEQRQFDRQRPVRGIGDAAFQIAPSSVVVKRIALASVWRWMKRPFGSSVSVSAPLWQRRHLDEIAQHVVVA